MTPEEQAAADKAAADKAAADKAAADKAAAEAAAKGETFDRLYVERLRKEAAEARAEAKKLADEKSEREAAEAKAANDHKKVAELAEKRAKDAEDKLVATTKNVNARLINVEVRALAREAGVLDVDDVKLLDISKITVNDDGEVVGAKEVIDAFKKDKPHKFKAADAGEGNAQQLVGNKVTPGTNTGASGEKVDYSDREAVSDEVFERAWATAGRK